MEYEALYQLILNDELAWEHLITSIIREEDMDPLNIDIIKLADKFEAITSKLKAVDFRFSGRFLHTLAILLKMQADRMLEDLLNKKTKEEARLDRYIRAIPAGISVSPKLPIIRNRPITLAELIDTIKSAMRATIKNRINFELKFKEVKIEDRIDMLIERLTKLFVLNEMIKFSQLLKKGDREDIVYTLLPLLFITNMHRVELSQEEPFTEIYVKNQGIR